MINLSFRKNLLIIKNVILNGSIINWIWNFFNSSFISIFYDWTIKIGDYKTNISINNINHLIFSKLHNRLWIFGVIQFRRQHWPTPDSHLDIWIGNGAISSPFTQDGRRQRRGAAKAGASYETAGWSFGGAWEWTRRHGGRIWGSAGGGKVWPLTV